MKAEVIIREWQDVLEIKNGRDYKNVLDENGPYPIYGSGGIIGYAKDYICPADTVIIGRKGNINNPIYVDTKFWNVDTAFGLVPKKDFLHPKYLFYFCVKYDFEKLNTTVTIPSLTKSNLLKIKMKLPPLDVQKHTANTLDKTQEIIDGYKKQLEELDNLIMSVFYEMFGDPVGNQKNWECRPIGELFTVASGGTPRTSQKEYWENGNISWIGSNLCQNEILYDNDGKYITQAGLENSSAKIFPPGTILVALVGATIGKVALLKFETTTNQNIAGIYVTENKNFTSEYVFLMLRTLYHKFIELSRGGFKMANLSFIRKLKIMVPPLELQNKFTEIVNKIEEQKALVKQAITESEHLFKSLMSKYFD